MRERRRTAVDGRGVARFLVRSTRRAALTLAGFLLVFVGLAGLVLPVLPGWVLIIGGFALLSREYSWAHSCLAFSRKQAVRGGSKIRTLAKRRRGHSGASGPEGDDVVDPSAEVVIDLTRLREEEQESATESRTSQAR